MFNLFRKNFDKELYESVADELESGQLDKALWLKAMTDSGNQKSKAQTLYIKYRLQELQNNKAELAHKNHNELEKQNNIRLMLATRNQLVSSTKQSSIHIFLVTIIFSAVMIYGDMIDIPITLVLLFAALNSLIFHYLLSKIIDDGKFKATIDLFVFVSLMTIVCIVAYLLVFPSLFMLPALFTGVVVIRLLLLVTRFTRHYNYVKRNTL